MDFLLNVSYSSLPGESLTFETHTSNEQKYCSLGHIESLLLLLLASGTLKSVLKWEPNIKQGNILWNETITIL